MSLDVLYLSWNRWEFTETTLRLLALNTDWSQVRKLVIYDDGSEPRTVAKLQELLLREIAIDDVEISFRATHYRSPVAVMVDYLKDDPADMFAKIDNDVAVPGGWLEALLSVWDDEIELLGMEIGMPHGLIPTPDEPRRYELSRHIGGVGLMRSSAFLSRRMPKPVGRFGFTEWQHIFRPVRGWIFPEVNAPCLDRVPAEPWASLSAFYESVGWQRPWWKYPLEAQHYWDWMEGVPA